MSIAYVCLVWKQNHSIIANPCICNCDNLNCNIWKLLIINISIFAESYINPTLQPMSCMLKTKGDKQKNGVQHFIPRSCDEDGGWSSILAGVCAQGFLFPRLTGDCCCSWYITMLMVVLLIIFLWNIIKKNCTFIFFHLILVLNVIYTCISLALIKRNSFVRSFFGL